MAYNPHPKASPNTYAEPCHKGGTYKDCCDKMSASERLPLNEAPQGPSKSPFGAMRNLSGSRG